MGKLSSDEIRALVSSKPNMEETKEMNIEALTADTIEEAPAKTIEKGVVSRNILVIGTGDGGCNIASAIRDRIPDVRVIAYNTSNRAMDNIHADVSIIPTEEDGSGKVREYSQEVFKKGSYKHLLAYVKGYTDPNSKGDNGIINLEYIVVTTTCDGGTGGGVSPMVAKFIADNVSIPVIVIGVYPSIKEDSMSQYNAMMWQADIEKTGLPYMIFDNDAYEGPKSYVHNRINTEIADAMEVLTGAIYGDTNIQAIDNRDMLMLIRRVGGRIVIYTGNSKPTVGQSLDSFIVDNLGAVSSEPMPKGMSAAAVFLKGSTEFISSTDTSLMTVRQAYGNADLMYTHLERSDKTSVSFIAAGCGSPELRLSCMKQRYDDIRNAEKVNTAKAIDMIGGMENPLGVNVVKTVSSEPDFSALDL